jgi:hypothetical protein
MWQNSACRIFISSIIPAPDDCVYLGCMVAVPAVVVFMMMFVSLGINMAVYHQ